MSRTVVEGGAVVAVDGPSSPGLGTERPEGHLIVEDDRFAAVGAGPAPPQGGPGRRIDASGWSITPDPVSTHHLLPRRATRGRAVDSTLFGWLTELYPVRAGVDEDLTHAAASAGSGWWAPSGCTTAVDHHYASRRGGVLRAVVSGAHRVGVRLRTPRAEAADEHEQYPAEFGRTPVGHAGDLGWLGPDVRLAHTVHLPGEVAGRLGRTDAGAARCPSSSGRLGTGVIPVLALLDARVPVGPGVGGVAPNEAGGLGQERRHVLLTSRSRLGPEAPSVRGALWTATRGGARCVGLDDELGSLEVGELADIAMWDIGGLGRTGIADLAAALVLGPLPMVRRAAVRRRGRRRGRAAGAGRDRVGPRAPGGERPPAPPPGGRVMTPFSSESPRALHQAFPTVLPSALPLGSSPGYRRAPRHFPEVAR